MCPPILSSLIIGTISAANESSQVTQNLPLPAPGLAAAPGRPRAESQTHACHLDACKSRHRSPIPCKHSGIYLQRPQGGKGSSRPPCPFRLQIRLVPARGSQILPGTHSTPQARLQKGASQWGLLGWSNITSPSGWLPLSKPSWKGDDF